MRSHTAALTTTGELGLSRYLEEIRRVPMLEPREEYLLAKSQREHGDREAAHRLVTSHLRLVAKIAMGYRGYGLPISEVISEGNVGLMQAVKRFEPDKGFRLATYAMWWIKAAIQEYILRSWSLVKMGTTANQKKLPSSTCARPRAWISALEEGDLRPDQVQIIANRLGVAERDVVEMNRRLGGDGSLNAPIGARMTVISARVAGLAGGRQHQPGDSPRREPGGRQPPQGAGRGLDRAQRARTPHFRGAPASPTSRVTLEKLADEFGISRERVRQIEVRAFSRGCVTAAVKNSITS